MSSRKNANDCASSSRSNRNKDDNGPEINLRDDKLFEPSLEMMVNDFDDESTLEMEEKIASTEAQDPNAELNSLQRVSYAIPFYFILLSNFYLKLLFRLKMLLKFTHFRKVICQSKNY